MERGTWWAIVHEVARVIQDLASKPPPLRNSAPPVYRHLPWVPAPPSQLFYPCSDLCDGYFFVFIYGFVIQLCVTK